MLPPQGEKMREPGKKQSSMGKRVHFFFVCIIITPILMCGCSHNKSIIEEANDSYSHGNYQDSLKKYEQLIEQDPTKRDMALFEMGVIYSQPRNEQKNYQKSLECFQKVISDYPGSIYRHDSEMMIFNINNVILKDNKLCEQKAHIENLLQEVKNKENEIVALQEKIKALEKKISDLAILKVSADKILIEKKERRLKVISKGEVLKTYKIALGGNPLGPKERRGDNKTPEGTYVIVSRNRDSRYHRSLHISYPNERDKKRARELGVDPGGNIMIHGIKNGFSQVGEAQAEVDWTKGCIAVTDEEIEEIDKLAPNGTVVEIRPWKAA